MEGLLQNKPPLVMHARASTTAVPWGLDTSKYGPVYSCDYQYCLLTYLLTSCLTFLSELNSLHSHFYCCRPICMGTFIIIIIIIITIVLYSAPSRVANATLKK